MAPFGGYKELAPTLKYTQSVWSAFAIIETNFKALVALGMYKHVMGFGLATAGMIYGLTLGLTNGLK